MTVTTETEGNVDTARFEAGQRTEVITVSTAGTTFNSGDGITLRVRPAREFVTADYRVGSPASAKVEVTEPTVTLGTLTLSAVNTNTFLGSTFEYMVRIEPAPAMDTSVPVTIAVSDEAGTGNLTLEPMSLSVDDSGTAKGLVHVTNSGTIATRSPIRISVTDPSANYTFVPSSKMVEVPIVAEPVAVDVSITGPTAGVTEGTNADFTLTASNATRDTDLTIAVSVADLAGRNDSDGNLLDYVQEDTLYVVLKANQESVSLSVPTKEPAGDEIDGLMVATILDGVGYDPKTDENVAYADIFDDDAPDNIRVAVNTLATPSVVEGQPITFRLNTFGTLTADFEVRYDLIVTGDVTTQTALIDQPITILADRTPANVIVPTKKLAAELGADAGIELVLRTARDFAGAKYRVTTGSRAKIGVRDEVPVLSIIDAPSFGTLGHAYRFKIKAEPAPTVELTNVPVRLVDFSTTDIIASTDPASAGTSGTINFPANQTEIEIVINTIDIDNPSGTEGLSFDFGTPPPGAKYEKTLAQAFPSFRSNNSPTASRPSISITPASTGLVRADLGAQAMFTITSDPLPNVAVPVKLKITETGNFIATSVNKTPTEMLSTAQTDNAFSVLTADPNSSMNDPNSDITVEILDDGDNYTLADSPDHKATVTATDDLIRTISISAPRYVEEGDMVTFTLSATPEPTGTDSVSVSFSVNHTGSNDYYDESTLSTTSPVTLNDANKTRDITFTTLSGITTNPASGADGDIEIEITGGGTDYVAASDMATVVTVQDADLIPEVSIARISPATIDEGETAIFELSAGTPGASSDFKATVEVSITSGDGNFLARTPPYTVEETILAATDKGTLRIPTVADTDDENNVTISVEVQTDPNESDSTKPVNYTASTTPASITIEDNDVSGATTAVTISGPAKVYEGQSADFTITANPAPTGTDVVRVNYRITEVGFILSYLG